MKRTTPQIFKKFAAAIVLGMLSFSFAHAAVLTPITSHTDDMAIGLDPGDNPVILTGPGNDAAQSQWAEIAGTNAGGIIGGPWSSKKDMAYVMMFQLPTLTAGEVVQSAVFSVELIAGNFITNNSGVDLYGVRSNSSSALMTSDWGHGANTGGADLIQDNFIDYGVGGGYSTTFGNVDTVISTNAAAELTLGTWLQGLYDGGAVAGDYAFLRLNLDASSTNRPRFTTANAGGNVPTLTITTAPIPEPETYAMFLSVAILGFVVYKRRRNKS